MRTYHVILSSLFTEDMLVDNYPVVERQNSFVVVISTSNMNAPIGEGWVIFSGEDANVKCAEYLEEINNESRDL